MGMISVPCARCGSYITPGLLDGSPSMCWLCLEHQEWVRGDRTAPNTNEIKELQRFIDNNNEPDPSSFTTT